MICCRFDNGTKELEEVGRFIRKNATHPSFVVRDVDQEHEIDHEIYVACNDMIDRRVFNIDTVLIRLREPLMQTLISLNLPGTHGRKSEIPISGFPRALMQKDFRMKI